MVFVEYESEVNEEEARLKALLEKLRIDASIKVFWLAAGQLQSYEAIINGRGSNSDFGYVVNEVLKDDEWWQELQRFRTESHDLSRSQELASLEAALNATKRRGSSISQSDAHYSLPKGLDFNELLDRSKKPTISAIAKLGGNFGIHTHQLNSSAFDVPTYNNTPDFSDDDEGVASPSDVDFNDVASEDGGGDIEDLTAPQRSSLLTFAGRRRRHGDIMRKAEPSKNLEQPLVQRSGYSSATGSTGYGTMAPTTAPTTAPTITPKSPVSRTQSSSGLLITPLESGQTTPTIAKAPTRPALSRHSSASRFTSRPTPETTVLIEGDTGPRIMFEEDVPSPRVRRPVLSRNASAGPFSSRPVPETKVENEDEFGPRLAFTEPETNASEPLLKSRRNSASRKEGSSDAQPNMPALLSSYHFDNQPEDDARSTYSTQSLPLSFNDLPSRAQHLILNELMRQNSSDTAVLLTTLPIPEEGTCKSEEASLRYLTDIEVLCHELPPVLLVLSNNMTVTVSL